MKQTTEIAKIIKAQWTFLFSIFFFVFVPKEKKKVFVYTTGKDITENMCFIDRPECLENFIVNEIKTRYDKNWEQTNNKTKADHIFVFHQTSLILKDCLEEKKEKLACKKIALEHFKSVLINISEKGLLKEKPEKHVFIFGHTDFCDLFKNIEEEFPLRLLEETIIVCSEKPSFLPFNPKKIIQIPFFEKYEGLKPIKKKKRKIVCVFHTLRYYKEENTDLIVRIISFEGLFPELFYLVQTEKIIPYLYWQTLINSEFVICLGGSNGQSSCVYEAIVAGVIPVWISNTSFFAFQKEGKHKIPYEKICIYLSPSNIDEIPFIIQNMTQKEKEKYRKEGDKYKKMFQYKTKGENPVFFLFEEFKS